MVTPLGDARYLLSPGDLYALRQMPDIVEIGISALKIEGRYKDADYVALTTAAYRQAVDDAWAKRPLSVTPAQELNLEQVYSRGLGPHFIAGTNHQTVVSGRAPRHRGVCLGKVTAVHADGVTIAPTDAHALAPLKPGDGVVFDAADWRSPEEPEEGGRVYVVAPARDSTLRLEFGNGAVDFRRIRPGDLLWRTHDPDVDKQARPFTTATTPVAKQPVDVHVVAVEGRPLRLEWRLTASPRVRAVVQSADPLPGAQQRPIDEAYLTAQLGRLGNTPYALNRLTLDLAGQPFAPSSLLNQLRREAVDQLAAQQATLPTRTLNDPAAVIHAALAEATAPDVATMAAAPQLHVLVRTPAQLAAVLPLRPAGITLDYLELYGLRTSVEQVQAAGIEARVASPRVLKPQEQRIVNFLLRLECPILARSAGLLEALHEHAHAPMNGVPLIGDFSLDAANVIAARSFLRLGLSRLTPTHDLNAKQITMLAREVGGDKLEVITYQHLPVFHTEHCVFCRFLSEGTSYKDCGHPCEQHKVALRDVNGRAHPVMADVGCRNTVFGAEAQEASTHLDAWLAAGIRHVRLEFVHETGAEAAAITAAFAARLRGEIDSAALGARLATHAPQGVTAGSLFVPANFTEIPLLD